KLGFFSTTPGGTSSFEGVLHKSHQKKGDVMRVVCLLFREAQELHSLAEVFYRFSPQVALRSSMSLGDDSRSSVHPGVTKSSALFLEIDQCRKIYNEKTILL